MQSNTSNLPPRARGSRHANAPPHARWSQPITEMTCPACGYQGQPAVTGGYCSCHHCGNHITADGDAMLSRRHRWVAYWGDALVVLAICGLAYLLTRMGWHAFFHP